MSNNHIGNRKRRSEQTTRTINLGNYLIITNTDETEKNYFYGLRDSLPDDIKSNIVIKVEKAPHTNFFQKRKN